MPARKEKVQQDYSIDATAHFGAREVPRAEKARLVGEVFTSAAPKYDLMNDLMSAGLHRLWKARMVSMITPLPGARLLDVAGGTGDIAFRFLARAREKGVEASATVCDINQAMLEEGRARAVDRNILAGIEWRQGDAEDLPFPDGTFDYVTIAFGIRNITDIPKALRGMRRVLKRGGRFVCLEFSQVRPEFLAGLYDSYSFKIIPWLGARVTGDRAAYQYLVESIRKFPSRESFSAMLGEAGFSRVRAEPMTLGVVAIHSGWKE